MHIIIFFFVKCLLFCWNIPLPTSIEDHFCGFFQELELRMQKKTQIKNFTAEIFSTKRSFNCSKLIQKLRLLSRMNSQRIYSDGIRDQKPKVHSRVFHFQRSIMSIAHPWLLPFISFIEVKFVFGRERKKSLKDGNRKRKAIKFFSSS